LKKREGGDHEMAVKRALRGKRGLVCGRRGFVGVESEQWR
jgi:hypothetical protein